MLGASVVSDTEGWLAEIAEPEMDATGCIGARWQCCRMVILWRAQWEWHEAHMSDVGTQSGVAASP